MRTLVILILCLANILTLAMAIDAANDDHPRWLVIAAIWCLLSMSLFRLLRTPAQRPPSGYPAKNREVPIPRAPRQHTRSDR